jgi:hypothetical protein
LEGLEFEKEEGTDNRYIHFKGGISYLAIVHGSVGGRPRFVRKATERPRPVPPREESTSPNVHPGILMPRWTFAGVAFNDMLLLIQTFCIFLSHTSTDRL